MQNNSIELAFSDLSLIQVAYWSAEIVLSRYIYFAFGNWKNDNKTNVFNSGSENNNDLEYKQENPR